MEGRAARWRLPGLVLGREDRVRGCGGSDFGERRHALRCPRVLHLARPRPGPCGQERHRPRGVQARPQHRCRRRPRCRPRSAPGRVRGTDHPTEGPGAPGPCGPAVRRRHPAAAARRRPGHPGDRRRVRHGVRRTQPRPRRQRDLGPGDAATGVGATGPHPRDGLRLPVGLRAARHREPRGDGLRDGRGGVRGGRHSRGGRRRRHRDVGALRPEAGGGSRVRRRIRDGLR